LDTFDVSDPASPKPLRTFSNPAFARAIRVHGHSAFLTGGGLLILDVSDPRYIRQLSHYLPTERTERTLAVEGDLVFLGTYWTGLHIIDVREPRFPRQIGKFETEGTVVAVAVSGDWLFVGTTVNQEGQNSVVSATFVLNINDPSQPRLVGSDAVWPSDIMVDGKEVFVSAGNGGLSIFELPSFTTAGAFRPGFLTLWWNRAALGMTLEQKNPLSESEWMPVIGSERTNRLSVPIESTAGLFRLSHRP
jgi:hypothetical protein